MAISRFNERFNTRVTRRVARRVDRVFSSLEGFPFFRQQDKKEFRYFRRLFLNACEAIDRRIRSGEIKPWTKEEITLFSDRANRLTGTSGSDQSAFEDMDAKTSAILHPGKHIRAGIFIGSFDPFQMTHLETALRFLARAKNTADIVFVVPEGAYSASKPERSDYGYRYDLLSRQIQSTFCPFIVPLNIGENQDTIGIVSRIIGLSKNCKLNLTHILGSDIFPVAANYYQKDFETWKPETEKHSVRLEFEAYVVKRTASDNISQELRNTRKQGIPVQLDPKPIGTPSSSELREQGVFTIIFPTPEVIEKLEVVFRYGMHRHWLKEKPAPEGEL